MALEYRHDEDLNNNTQVCVCVNTQSYMCMGTCMWILTKIASFTPNDDYVLQKGILKWSLRWFVDVSTVLNLDYIDSPLVILYFLRLDWDLINKDRVNLTFMLPFKSKLFTLITLKFVKILSLCYLNYLILIAVTQPKKLKLNFRNLICLIPEGPQDHPKIYTRAILFLMIAYLGAVTLPTKGNDTQIHKNRYILEHTRTLLQNSQGIGLIGYI